MTYKLPEQIEPSSSTYSGIVREAYNIDKFGTLTVTSDDDGLRVSCRNFTFSTPSGENEGFTPKLAFQAVINALQKHCDSMSDAASRELKDQVENQELLSACRCFLLASERGYKNFAPHFYDKESDRWINIDHFAVALGFAKYTDSHTWILSDVVNQDISGVYDVYAESLMAAILAAKGGS